MGGQAVRSRGIRSDAVVAGVRRRGARRLVDLRGDRNPDEGCVGALAVRPAYAAAASATPFSRPPSRSSSAAATRASGSASTPRTRPERRACTCGPACTCSGDPLSGRRSSVPVVSELRAPREDEFDAMLEPINAHQLAAFGDEMQPRTSADLVTAPWVDVERDSASRAGRPARRLRRRRSEPGRPPLWWCDLKVAPEPIRSDHARAVAWRSTGRAGHDQGLDVGR